MLCPYDNHETRSDHMGRAIVFVEPGMNLLQRIHLGPFFSIIFVKYAQYVSSQMIKKMDAKWLFPATII